MSDKEFADFVCRTLLALVAGIRKKYGLPEYRNITLIVTEKIEQTITPVMQYDTCKSESSGV